MFGVVPKPLWERRIAPDARNRIPLALRCLLVEHDDGLVLVDTGIGNKDDAKFREIYGVESLAPDGRRSSTTPWPRGATRPPTSAGWSTRTCTSITPAATRSDAGGGAAADVPHARYVVQRGELEFARHTNERTAGSYLAPNFAGGRLPPGARGRSRSCRGSAACRRRGTCRTTSPC